MFHFALRHEHGRRKGTQDQDVQVAEVIANEQTARWNRAISINFNIQHTQYAAATLLEPMGAESQPALLTSKHNCRDIRKCYQQELGRKPSEPKAQAKHAAQQSHTIGIKI